MTRFESTTVRRKSQCGKVAMFRLRNRRRLFSFDIVFRRPDSKDLMDRWRVSVYESVYQSVYQSKKLFVVRNMIINEFVESHFSPRQWHFVLLMVKHEFSPIYFQLLTFTTTYRETAFKFALKNVQYHFVYVSGVIWSAVGWYNKSRRFESSTPKLWGQPTNKSNRNAKNTTKMSKERAEKCTRNAYRRKYG